MSSCPTCGNRDYLCQSCKMEELEDRLGLPEDHFDADAGIVCWIQDIGGDWHASMYFEGTRHAAACGECFETPVADVRDDPRRLADAHTCEDCEAYLEADDDETVPDGGEFAPASELRADGGEVDVYQWVLDNVHEYPAGTDSRWGSRGNLVHQGRKLDGVTKEDVQMEIARAVENEDLLSWHGLLVRVEIDRLREITRVEHEEHDITRGILVGKCNKLIATKKQEQGDEPAEREVATDGGHPEPEILDAVDAPGGECEMWSGEGPSPCGNDADYLVVYAASTRPDDDRRKNMLACSGCFTPRKGEAIDRGEAA
ncbi:hypothetical protein [Natrinema sp. DC36]|uniref:hypothetical protein n=1 Tax=Natrinema sp. DC36 TaxID=2878680 RepID=UPI001CF07AC9|nr:hypothetical protein [Natrinema sp. DC36]